MGKSKNHITNSEEYQRYLEGSMTSKERHDFEKHLLDDAFESDALDGFSEVDPGAIPEDLSLLSQQLKKKSEKASSFMYWRIAASVLILALFSFAIYFMIEMNTSPEIVQNRDSIEDEGSLLTDEKTEILDDSVTGESERIIAYKQETDKGIEEKPAIPAAVVPEPIDEEVEDMEVELDLNVVEDSYEVFAERTEIQEAEPAELPTLDHEEVPLEINSEGSSKSAIAMESVPPTAMKQSRYSTRFNNLRTVTGKIVSVEDNTPVPGVNVIVKGSSVGTVSDIDGNYKINVPEDEDATLVYSYIGLNSEEMEVKDQDSIDVAMEPDFKQLSEIVVTAHGVDEAAEDKPYSFIPPKPKGGNSNWKDYIEANLRYPESGLEKAIKGTVKLKFSVGTDGRISNLEVVKSLGEDFDQEAIRLVVEGPDWEPAIENDSAVARDVKVKIRFKAPE